MRKWILLLLTALCIVSGAAAEEEIQPLRYAPGDEVPLRLYVTAPGLAGLQMRLRWDTQIFELADTDPALRPFFSEDAMLTMVYAEPEEGELTLVWLRETDVTLTNVCMLELTLRVREDARGGISAATIAEFLLADMQGTPLMTQADGVELDIDAPLSAATPLPAATPVPTPVPEAAAAQEPAPTALPAVAFIWLTDQVLPEELAVQIEPTPTPGQYIPSRPRDAADLVSISPTPAAKSTQTPVPTPVTVVIGATPVPAPEAEKLRLRVTETADGFRAELIAEAVNIGGLQATISYDPSAARCTGAAFTDTLRDSALVHMVNQNPAGKIRLVYAGMNGYQAAGEAIFTADFIAEDAQQVVLTLMDVMCTNAETELSTWRMAPQETVWRIQPMNDMTEKGGGMQ